MLKNNWFCRTIDQIERMKNEFMCSYIFIRLHIYTIDEITENICGNDKDTEKDTKCTYLSQKNGSPAPGKEYGNKGRTIVQNIKKERGK